MGAPTASWQKTQVPNHAQVTIECLISINCVRPGDLMARGNADVRKALSIVMPPGSV